MMDTTIKDKETGEEMQVIDQQVTINSEHELVITIQYINTDGDIETSVNVVPADVTEEVVKAVLKKDGPKEFRFEFEAQTTDVVRRS